MEKKLLSTISKTVVILLVSISSQAQVTMGNKYENLTSDAIGTFQNIAFREGGFSSLAYIPNTNGAEFWTLSDRGVNVDAANANATATASVKYPTCKPTYDKIYAFPTYAPKIHRVKIEGTELKILQTISIKRPGGTTATGIINPTGLGSTAAEVASTNIVTDCADFDTNTAPKDIWGIDSEGIDVDKDGNFWICEEGGPTIWKLNSNGVVLKRYTPYSQNPQPEDVIIDACFSFRRNNRGFEGITVTPNGKIYAIIQSPLYYKAASGVAGSGTLASSQIHRILEIDPTTNATKMYAYVNDGTIGAIKPKDIKIGDLRAINNTTFLVLEQAATAPDDIKRMYTIDITNATNVQSGLAYGGKTLEELNTPTALASNNIVPVTKTLFFDLYAKGWPVALDKAEGIAIIDSNTIAICNDNDYAQTSVNQDGIAAATTTKSTVYLFNLAGASALANYIPNTNVVLSLNSNTPQDSTVVYPNPTNNFITIQNAPLDKNYAIYDSKGILVDQNKIKNTDTKIDLSTLTNGIYTIKIEGQVYKIIKN
ncbi:MAG: hypothetical protein QG594_1428 [Bacteroidota bacterium]|nr:hypothetical protein [Bacteroidota bacterium]